MPLRQTGLRICPCMHSFWICSPSFAPGVNLLLVGFGGMKFQSRLDEYLPMCPWVYYPTAKIWDDFWAPTSSQELPNKYHYEVGICVFNAKTSVSIFWRSSQQDQITQMLCEREHFFLSCITVFPALIRTKQKRKQEQYNLHCQQRISNTWESWCLFDVTNLKLNAPIADFTHTKVTKMFFNIKCRV